MKKTLFSSLFLLSASSFWAQQKIAYEAYDLPNGLHVILHEEHATPIVAVSVLYHVGSKNENTNRTGFAHFFEHLLFEGSANIGRGEYSELVEKNGGTLNANTSQDRTYYYEVLPSNQLELGLWLESERMLHAKVDIKGIETQRSVVKEEKRQRVDNQPYGSFFTEMFKRVFTTHPYNWAPIGSMEHLDAAQEEDYVNFYKTFYVPSNATLSIAGDINIEQTKKWIAQYFGSIPQGQAINLYRDYVSLSDDAFLARYKVNKSSFDAKNFMASSSAEAKKLIASYSNQACKIERPLKDNQAISGVVKDTIYDNIQLPALFMGYKMPSQTHPDTYALEFLNEVLSSGSSSRINKEIVEKRQLAQYAFSFNYGLEDAGIGIMAAIAPKEVALDTLLAAFDAQIATIKNELISEEEFQKVRNKFENDIASSNSSIAGIAENLADNHVYYGDANRVNTLLSNYLKVTREDIQRVAKTYLTQDARVILYYLPKEK
ncbi:MAG: M16 family metallopeptidase [Flavobacteriales bacterium]